MMQGDSYNLAVRILNNAGNPVTDADVVDVEMTLGRLTKSLKNGEISFLNGRWMFPVSQAESFQIPPGAVKAQVRVKWANGVLEGKKLYGLTMEESISKEVL